MRQELTDREWECARLHFREGLSLTEIARRLGIHKGGVSRHLKAARRKLKGLGPREIPVDPAVLDRIDPRRVVGVA